MKKSPSSFVSLLKRKQNLTIALLSFILASFTTVKIVEDFMQQLGISQSQLNRNISNTFLGGSFNYWGAKNLKTLAFKDRAGIVTEVCKYTKEYVLSDAFKKEYAQLRENSRPAEGNKIQSPEEMRSEMISRLKESITKTEASLKTANAQMKPIFEDVLKSTKKQLKEAEDPNNEMMKSYAENYPQMVEMNKQVQANRINEWETQYPADPNPYVKKRLQQFLDATEGVDYGAATVEKNGKKYFTSAEYERKSDQWKMAFRAGKEPTEAARKFVKEWLSQMK